MESGLSWEVDGVACLSPTCVKSAVFKTYPLLSLAVDGWAGDCCELAYSDILYFGLLSM